MLSSKYKNQFLSRTVFDNLGVALEQAASGTSSRPRLWVAGFWSKSSNKSLPLRELGVAVLLLVTVVLLYFRLGAGLIAQWWRDPNYSHGFIVPLLALYVLWQSRRKLEDLPPEPSWWGLLVIFGALGSLIIGTLGAELCLSRVSFLFLIAGLVINFWGWRHFRVGLVAWLILFLMIPLPLLVLNQIVLPLQFLSSALATGFMDFCGVPVYRQGNIIFLPSLTLEVAEACSGIRSLMAMVTLAVAYGFLLERKSWRRAVLIVSAVPIAVVANGMRIMTSGILGQHWGPDKAEGFFHFSSGLVIFTLAFLLLWTLHTVLRRFGARERRESIA